MQAEQGKKAKMYSFIVGAGRRLSVWMGMYIWLHNVATLTDRIQGSW